MSNADAVRHIREAIMDNNLRAALQGMAEVFSGQAIRKEVEELFPVQEKPLCLGPPLVGMPADCLVPEFDWGDAFDHAGKLWYRYEFPIDVEEERRQAELISTRDMLASWGYVIPHAGFGFDYKKPHLLTVTGELIRIV